MKYRIRVVQYAECSGEPQVLTAYTSTMSHVETAIAAYFTDTSIAEICITERSECEEITIFTSYRG